MAEKSATNFFGLTNFRNQKAKFGIKTDDRRRHFYCIGKTGMGKSNLMENMAIQDIQAGRGIAYVDPHGEGAEKLLNFVPADRINDVVFLNPADLDYPIAFNVMEKVDFRYRHLVAGGLMGVFKKVWPDVWSARMEYILNNSILALLEYPDSTLLGVNRMLSDPDYREKVVAKITDPIVKSFWVIEFAKYSQRYEQEATAAIQNKVGQFISNPLIRNMIGQTKSTIDMREIMDTQKIFIMDLAKGRIGEDNSRLLGALLITKLQLAAMSRVDVPEEERKDFYLYVDEFQNFATESFANILSEARKYRLNIILGHQYIGQLVIDGSPKMRDAIFGNVGTLAVFRVGAEDAEFLEREFSPQFTAEDLVNLPKYNVYLKLMIDGVAGHPFSAETLPPPPPLEESNKEKIIKASRERYGVKKSVVEEKITRWAGLSDDGQSNQLVQQRRQEQRPGNFQRNAMGQGNQQQQSQTTLYEAVCSNCGKATKVIFPPEKGRPIYCKSCLKKMKESPMPPQPAPAKPMREEERSQEPKRPEFARENAKIENVSFHSPKKSGNGGDRNEQRRPKPYSAPQERPKRKEINLSELRKALEESLEKKPQAEEPEEIEEKVVDNTVVQNTAAKSPENELKKRMEEEQEMDKIKAPETPKALPSAEKKNGKKVIKPGETIKL